MTQLPMIPSWDGLHPLMIHFPIVLFLWAPVFLLFAAFTRADTQHFPCRRAPRDGSRNCINVRGV
jgi:uncharacterized membrane protein